jgi:ectoine hydroxylase-related dioxygenase (phytanoyl-CoA dioxygenase family)
MKTNLYSGLKQKENTSELDFIVEEINNLGFTIVEGYFDSAFVDKLRSRALDIYEIQEKEFGRDSLREINDHDLARNLVDYDPIYMELIEDKFINSITKKILGEVNVLSLSNAIINRSDEVSCQSRWHRDFPYQNFLSDEILGLNVFIALDDFTEDNGSTIVVPFSNRFKELPTDKYLEKHSVKAICPKGSIIIFDSMLLHQSGFNKSGNTRVGLNLNYVRPFIKQQYHNIETQYSKTSSLFGTQYYSSKDAKEFRTKRFK